MWNADVNFDLAAFHSMVRILKRSLRHLTEASLASVLLKDMTQVKLLPPGFMCASPTSKDHLQTHSLLPTFMLPRACMGIVFDFFLRYEGEPDQFLPALVLRFPCCMFPKQDMQQAIIFWEDVRRCVDEMCTSGLDCTDSVEDMRVAGEMLLAKQKLLGLYPEPDNFRGDESDRVKDAALAAYRACGGA